jgi:RecJ-like exonuclease
VSDSPTATYAPIVGVAERSLARVRGRIVAIQVEPAGVAPSLTVRVQDETGRIDAVFMGRRSIPGIEPGKRIGLEGRVCASQAAPRMYNPRYELLCRE